MIDHFYIDKTTNTFADELLAAGVTRVLEELASRQGQRANLTMTQTDHGHYYEIHLTPPLNLEHVANTPPFVVAPIIRTVKNAKKLPELPNNPTTVIDYDHERDQRAAFLTAFKELESTAKRAYIVGDDANFPFASMPLVPHKDWDIFRLLNPAALISYNTLMTQWYDIGRSGKTGAVCQLICALFSQTPNDLATATQQWKKLAKSPQTKPYPWKETVTASQFFNPSQGKGINKPLPNGVGLGNLKTFWLLEWLKVVGFYQIAHTRQLQGVKDRKTYVPAFGRADLIAQQDIRAAFKRKMRFAETAVKSDILTIIRYLQAFIERVEAAQQETASPTEQAFLSLLNKTKRPSNFMRGFHTVFYKDLGNAVTTMNIAFLNLPGWVEIAQPEDSHTFKDILSEQARIVRQFAENKGEEITLLQQFRDFIVADNLDPFFEFTTAYSSWLISQGEKKGGFPPRRFDINNLRRLIVKTDPQLSPILESEGFRNIAYAIRQSTVTAQYRKKEGDRRYDVRYGLGRDLVRQSQYPADFIAALSDFLHKYNAENAQVMETRPGPYRRSILTSDIEEITRLIDIHGSEVVAKLLTAFGYARIPRTTNDENEE